MSVVAELQNVYGHSADDKTRFQDEDSSAQDQVAKILTKWFLVHNST